ncbi:MAG: hypothetical protein ACRDYZ_07085, partial [Acidimicrobiales bacterium]
MRVDAAGLSVVAPQGVQALQALTVLFGAPLVGVDGRRPRWKCALRRPEAVLRRRRRRREGLAQVGQDGQVLMVPRDWSEVTPSWMTQALAARLPGTVVDGVEVGPVQRGTSARARVRLTYAAGRGPTSVFVKGPGRLTSRLALAALGAVTTEARLADAGADLPLEHPSPYAAGVDGPRLAAVVVMDDVVAAGGRPNDGRAPLGANEVQSGLRGLARLHATYWGGRLPPAVAFLRPWRLGRAWALVSLASL